MRPTDRVKPRRGDMPVKKAKKKVARKPAKRKVATKKVAKKKVAKKAVKKVRCAAKTAAGTRCKRTASGKSKFCASHKK